MDELSELDHIRISNRGDGFQNTSSEQPGSQKYTKSLCFLRKTWYDYAFDSSYFGTEIEISKKYQIFFTEFDENSWELDVNIRLPGDLVLWKHFAGCNKVSRHNV